MMKLLTDQIVIYPTDTVWGIGCNIFSKTGLSDIHSVKRSDSNKPLSILFSSVELVREYFDLNNISNEWLVEFFSIGTSLGIPIELLRKPMPDWIVNLSQTVSVRVIDSHVLDLFFKENNFPIFTTSLNLTLEAPIKSYKDAIEFKNMYVPSALFIGDRETILSGYSSTIVFFDKKLNYKIIREGKNIEEVKNHLLKLAKV